MTEHVTAAEITRFHGNELQPAEVLFVLRHLSACAGCRTLTPACDDEIAQIQRTIAAALHDPTAHLTPDSDIFPYMDGLLGDAEREIVESHIEDCELCRTEVEQIAALKRPRTPQRLRLWAVAAAIVLPLSAAGIAWIALVQSRPHPALTRKDVPVTPGVMRVAPPPTYAQAQWTSVVATTLAQGRLPVSPRLDELRESRGTVRGEGDTPPAALGPAGEVIDSVRPRFHWSSRRGSEYVLTLFDSDDREVVRSPRLRRPAWVCDRDLRRGETYVWQVEAMGSDGRIEVVPAAPEPPARFHVLSEREHQEIFRARRAHPDDHLLLAVLYARSGMEDDARDQLSLLASQPSPSDSVKRLLANHHVP